MASQRRGNGQRRARRQADRRLGLMVIGGTAAIILVVALAVLLPRMGAPDRSVEAAAQPEITGSAPQVAEGEPLVPQATPTPAPEPEPTPEPTPEPATQGGTVTFAQLRAATRPTPTAPGYGLVFSEADTEEKIIAITVDDCFQADNLQKMVDKAIEVGGKFTIFPIGRNVLKQAQSEVLKYAWEHGFELENHTFTHNGLYRCSDEEMAREVFMQQQALSHILGVEYHCHFLRPRGGDARRDQRMQVYAEQLGYYGIAHWSCAGSTSTEKEIAKAMKPGAIYLFHTTTDNDLYKLLDFMTYATQKGYQLVTLNEMFGYPENETEPLTMAAKDYPVPPLEPYARVYDEYRPTRYSWGVYLLQEKLIELGYMKGEPDGVYGQDCAKCVKAYQKDHGMEATGVADVALQEAIFGVPSGA